MNPQDILRNLKPTRKFFIGIDSDGCAFDTMEIKQKECFCPNLILHFELQKIQKYAREVWEFVNLYSVHRGVNRFLAVIEAFKLMNERPEVRARHFRVHNTRSLEEWTGKETKLGNPALEKYAATVDDPFIHTCLKWSKAVNRAIEEMVYGMPPFPFVRESLEKMNGHCDAIVVSQTPVEALEREWKENDIDQYVKFIAGQEYGTKAEHLHLAAGGKYNKDNILMIGDALGDLNAARDNGVLFFPINPGHEEQSWERFYTEGLDMFLAGKYKGSYQDSLMKEFMKYLPENPPWKRGE